MSKVKKIVIISVTALVAALIVLLIVTYCDLTDQPKAALMTYSAKQTAKEYMREKYGDSPLIIDTDPIYSGGFMFDRGNLEGILINYNGFQAEVVNGEVRDNRQNEDIIAAFDKKYLRNNELFSEMTGTSVSLLFADAETGADLTSIYFDGNIDEFLRAAKPRISVRASGVGYAGKNEEAPVEIRKMLENISAACPDEYSIFIKVTDPQKDLPEMPNKHGSGGLKYPPDAYEEYMELMAYGEAHSDSNDSGINIYQTHFYDIDDYTAISAVDAEAPLTSMREVYFEKVNYSENLTAYRGVYKYDDHADENILTIRPEGFTAKIGDRRQPFLLRLDRKHYEIGDSTIALRVTDTLKNSAWQGKRLYVSLGFYPYDCDFDSWYYITDDYLYLYVPYSSSDLMGLDGCQPCQIAFADVEGYKTTP